MLGQLCRKPSVPIYLSLYRAGVGNRIWGHVNVLRQQTALGSWARTGFQTEVDCSDLKFIVSLLLLRHLPTESALIG